MCYIHMRAVRHREEEGTSLYLPVWDILLYNSLLCTFSGTLPALFSILLVVFFQIEPFEKI